MLSVRYIVRLIQAFFNRFKAVILIGTFIGIVSFISIVFLFPSLSATHNRIGIVGRYSPDNLPENIANKISEGLTSIDTDGSVKQSLAKSWESNDGGKTWIFNLDENKKWQDGKKVTTDSINYEFNDASIQKIDSKTIKFSLNSPFSAFPIIVSKPLFKKGLLGTGEWKVKKVSMIGGYVQYIIISDSKSNTETYKFYPSEDRLKLAFKLGEINIMVNLYDSDPFTNWKTVNISKSSSYDNFVGIFLNADDEKLSDKSIRQALNYAINKNNFEEDRAVSPISPLSWSYNPQVKPYDRDLSKTKDLKDLTIKLSTMPNLLNKAELIKKDWQEAGLKVEIEVVSDVPDNYQAFLATVDIPKDPDQYSLWHSTQTSTNISHFKNPRIDKLLEDGRTELDQSARKKIYLDFQRFIVEDVPAIFLYHPTYYKISRK